MRRNCGQLCASVGHTHHAVKYGQYVRLDAFVDLDAFLEDYGCIITGYIALPCRWAVGHRLHGISDSVELSLDTVPLAFYEKM
jgi:hypothetical protein